MPSEPASPKRYSLNWARDVVKVLERQYARAWKQVLANYRITSDDVALYLSRGDPVFNYLKRRVQTLDSAIRMQERAPLAIQVYSTEANYLAKNTSGETFQRLDNRRKLVDALGAGSEGEGGDRNAVKGAALPSAVYQFLLFPEEEGANREVFEVRRL